MTNLDCNKENVSLIQYINCMDNPKGVTTSNHSPQQQQQQVDWVDTVVNCATIMNKIFTRNTCRLCHIYSDKQVEFEERIQENATITATAAEWYNLQQQQGTAIFQSHHNDPDDTLYQQQQPASADAKLPFSMGMSSVPPMSAAAAAAPPPPVDLAAVELYRKYLFDEESVVDSIELRIGRSTDDNDDDDDTDGMKEIQLT